MRRIFVLWSLLPILALTLLLANCGGGSSADTAALSADNVNLVFVVSPDLAYHTPGDIQPDTANLTCQGLNRSLQIAGYLKQQVLGSKNVTSIYALAPMTHPQTANQYPDMASIGFIQQFALLNQITLTVDAATKTTCTGNSFPIKTAYAPGSVPAGVAVPSDLPTTPPSSYCPDCSGLDFNNTNGSNDTLVSGIIAANTPGFYVFSAPWETISALMATINTQHGYGLKLPTTFSGSNHIYALAIPASGKASMVTWNSNLNPPATYPVLPAPVTSAACTHTLQPYFRAVRAGGVDGVAVPANANTNQTVYIVRHAEAHPDPEFKFENGNYVAAGQWRALSLSNALRGKINPDMVYSIDPAQWFPAHYPLLTFNVSYIRPSLTVLPFAIANNLPYSLVSSFLLGINPNDQDTARNTSDFFFTGGKFSNKTVLLAWESGHIRPFLNWLMATYGGNNPPQLSTAATSGAPAGGWPHEDYDTLWTVTLDARGNLTVDNALCEGIDSARLPTTTPHF